MDVSGMTLEGFFLADYERMRTRVIELEDEVKRLTPDGYGCLDLHETCDVVKVTVAGFYDLKNMANHTKGRFRVYVPEDQLEQLKEKLEEYDNYIQWLCQFVPEDRWDEVYDQMTAMGIDYIGPDDV